MEWLFNGHKHSNCILFLKRRLHYLDNFDQEFAIEIRYDNSIDLKTITVSNF